jgi:hypothetical protein
VSDKLGEIFIWSFGFFSDIQNISCDSEIGSFEYYVNYSDKDPIEPIPKEQGFDESAEIIIDRTETVTTSGKFRLWFHLIIYSKLKKIK